MSTEGSRVALDDSKPGDLVALENTLKAATSATSLAMQADDKTNTNDAAGTKTEKPDWIQEKFWTGDVNESATKQAQAYPNLQSAYGRMANDLGTQRKLTDQMLAIKRDTDLGTAPATAKPPAVNSRDLVDNPTETLDRYWKDREAALRKEWDTEQARQAANTAEQQFMARHGDFAEVTSTEDFSTWVHSSPLRKRAAALAGQGNYVVADELLTEYKAVKGQGPKPSADPNRGAKGATADEQAAARAAGVESSAQAGGATKGGPTYRRADLIALKMNKPEVYSDPKFQEEILRAYAEGRVK